MTTRSKPYVPEPLPERWKHLRATPEELAEIRASTPIMRPLEELVGGTIEDASAEEIADLESWLAEREEMRLRSVARLEEKLQSLAE
jgi:hypothetical protein